MTEPRYDTISFLSDYGTGDEFVGVVQSVIRSIAPDVAVIDMTHEIPPYDVRAGALDPGPQRPVPVPRRGAGRGRPRASAPPGGRWPSRSATGQSLLVGPDNGLLAPAVGHGRRGHPRRRADQPRVPARGARADVRRARRVRPGRRPPVRRRRRSTSWASRVDAGTLLPGCCRCPRRGGRRWSPRCCGSTATATSSSTSTPTRSTGWGERVSVRWSGPQRRHPHRPPGRHLRRARARRGRPGGRLLRPAGRRRSTGARPPTSWAWPSGDEVDPRARSTATDGAEASPAPAHGARAGVTTAPCSLHTPDSPRWPPMRPGTTIVLAVLLRRSSSGVGVDPAACSLAVEDAATANADFRADEPGDAHRGPTRPSAAGAGQPRQGDDLRRAARPGRPAARRPGRPRRRARRPGGARLPPTTGTSWSSYLAVLGAGAVAVPLNPASPAARARARARGGRGPAWRSSAATGRHADRRGVDLDRRARRSTARRAGRRPARRRAAAPSSTAATTTSPC